MSGSSALLSRIISPYLFRNGAMMLDLSEKELAIIQESSKPKSIKRGEVLFKQDTTPRNVIWLLSGKAKIFQETPGGQRQTLYVYSDGDLIGYRQLIAGDMHPVSSIALEASTILSIPANTFLYLIDHSPSFARKVLSALARDFTVWMNRTTVFTKFPVKRRLLLALLILYEQYRLSGSPEGLITITRTELAEYVGASLETVVRILNTLKSKELVQITGRRILLKDVDALVEIMQKESV